MKIWVMNLAMESGLFEDVFATENGDVPSPC